MCFCAQSPANPVSFLHLPFSLLFKHSSFQLCLVSSLLVIGHLLLSSWTPGGVVLLIWTVHILLGAVSMLHCFLFSLYLFTIHPVAGVRPSVAGEACPVAGAHHPVAGLTHSVAGVACPVAGAHHPVAGVTHSVAGVACPVAGAHHPVAGVTHSVAGVACPVAGVTHSVAGVACPVAGVTHSVAGVACPVAGLTHSVAGVAMAGGMHCPLAKKVHCVTCFVGATFHPVARMQCTRTCIVCPVGMSHWVGGALHSQIAVPMCSIACPVLVDMQLVASNVIGAIQVCCINGTIAAHSVIGGLASVTLSQAIELPLQLGHHLVMTQTFLGCTVHHG